MCREVGVARAGATAASRPGPPCDGGVGTSLGLGRSITSPLTFPLIDMDFLTRLQDSFATLGEIVPALFGAIVILFAGYLLAKLTQRGIERLLRKLSVNDLLRRGGVMQAVEHAGHQVNPSRVFGNIVFWAVMFAVLLVASTAAGLQSLNDVFAELVSYIPSIIAAVVIVIVGIVLGGFVEGLLLAAAGALHGGPTLARVGRGGIVVLAIFMALQELGVATDIVTTAFAILFGAVALALALAFGLGNRDLAGEVTRTWWARYQREKAAIDAEVAAEEAEIDQELADDEEDRAPVGAAAGGSRLS